jgi:hypothetical protein
VPSPAFSTPAITSAVAATTAVAVAAAIV